MPAYDDDYFPDHIELIDLRFFLWVKVHHGLVSFVVGLPPLDPFSFCFDLVDPSDRYG